MSAQPEALRLAEQLEAIGLCGPVAAELRRLHGMVERIGPLAERVLEIKEQRDALLGALRVFVSCALPVSTEIDERGHSWTEAYLDQALPIARAAIKAVEGEMK